MTYMLPAPRVQQILRSPNAILVDVDLYPTLVGPLYRVKRDIVIQPQGTILHPNASPVLTASYPYLDPGATVDTSSVRVFVKEGWATWINSLTAKTNATYTNSSGTYLTGFLAGLDYMIDPAVDFVATGVQAGDRVYVDGGDGTYVVSAVSANRLTFTSKVRKTAKTYSTGTVAVLGTAVTGTSTLWTTAASDIKAGLQIAFGTISGSSTWYTIASVDSATGITLEGTGPAVEVEAGAAYQIRRGYSVKRYYASFELSALDFIATSSSVEVDVAADGTHDFTSGVIDITYRALRVDKLGLYQYTSSTEVEVDMENDPLNPLGFTLCNGTFAANGNARPVLSYITAGPDDSSYIDALGEIQNYKKTYFLVPLTMSSAVCNAFSAHASAMSDWKLSYFRVAFVSRVLMPSNALLTATATAHA